MSGYAPRQLFSLLVALTVLPSVCGQAVRREAYDLAVVAEPGAAWYVAVAACDSCGAGASVGLHAACCAASLPLYGV